LRRVVADEIPLQCGLRLKPGFADNTLFFERRLNRLEDQES
jgi:hypothetical protein